MTISTEDWLHIADMITDFFDCLDRKDPSGLPMVFAEEASLDMGMADRPLLEGKAAIIAAFSAPKPVRQTRHLWSSLKIAAKGEGAIATFPVVVHVREGSADTPARIAHLCDNDIELVRDAAGDWRFIAMKRTVALAF